MPCCHAKLILIQGHDPCWRAPSTNETTRNLVTITQPKTSLLVCSWGIWVSRDISSLYGANLHLLQTSAKLSTMLSADPSSRHLLELPRRSGEYVVEFRPPVGTYILLEARCISSSFQLTQPHLSTKNILHRCWICVDGMSKRAASGGVNRSMKYKRHSKLIPILRSAYGAFRTTNGCKAYR